MNWILVVLLCGFSASHSSGAGLRMCLAKMGETDLVVSTTNSFSFRFTLLPTRGNPVSIRIERDGVVFELVAKRLAGQAGYRIGDLIETKEGVLSEEESKEVFKNAGKLRFFEMQATEEGQIGVDGERWFLEGAQRGKSLKVERWSPLVEAKRRGLVEFVEFCALLVKYSRLKEPPKGFLNNE